MGTTKTIYTNKLVTGLKALARRWGGSAVLAEAKPLVELLIKYSKNAPVPRGRYAGGGGLAGSDFVEVVGNSKIRFGFAKIYARFQDQPDMTGSAYVFPKRKTRIYIPISAKGRKHVYGANPNKEGLVWGTDYILLPKWKAAKIPIKGYGNTRGPNHFFSGTLKRKSGWFLQELGKALRTSAQQAAAEGRAAKD